MRRRINVSLSEDTIRLMDRVCDKGDRSRLIDDAVKHYVDAIGRRNLRRALAAGAKEHAARDRAIAEEWFEVDESAWQSRRE